MEHRYLNAPLLLNRIDADLVFVCSLAPDPEVLAYYRSLVPPEVADRMRRRLHVVAVDDSAPRPLAEKLLDRPDLLDEVRRPHRRAHCGDRAVERHRTRGGRRARTRHPGQRHRARAAVRGVQERRPAAVPPRRRPGAARPRGRAPRRRRGRRGRVDPRSRPDVGAVVVKLDDSGAGDGNVVVGAARRRRRPPATPTRCSPTWLPCRSGSGRISRPAGESSRRGSWATGCAAPAFRSTCCPAARCRCSPRTTRCSVATTGRSTSDAGSPPTPRTPRTSRATATPSAVSCGARLRRPDRRRLHGRPHRRPALVAHRPRGQPAQGRHDAPLLGPAQPGPRPLRHRIGHLAGRRRRQHPGLPLHRQLR